VARTASTGPAFSTVRTHYAQRGLGLVETGHLAGMLGAEQPLGKYHLQCGELRTRVAEGAVVVEPDGAKVLSQVPGVDGGEPHVDAADVGRVTRQKPLTTSDPLRQLSEESGRPSRTR
jgi:hypothetical protein